MVGVLKKLFGPKTVRVFQKWADVQEGPLPMLTRKLRTRAAAISSIYFHEIVVLFVARIIFPPQGRKGGRQKHFIFQAQFYNRGKNLVGGFE